MKKNTSIVDLMVKNSHGASVYAITNPSERLIATVGACNNEPKFYPVDPGNRVEEKSYSTDDFEPQAALVINTAMEVAMSDSPKDLLQIAHWARKEMKMRTIPQALLAVAAHCEGTKQFVKEYTPKVIQRADDLKQAFIAYRSLFGTGKTIPNSLKKGLAEAFKKFRPLDFVKWEGKDRPHFSDLLSIIDRKKDYPLSKELSHYLYTGEITDPEKLPELAARQALTKLEHFTPEAKELARKSRANWETLVSQFGNTKEVWEHLIETEQLGYMATVRNLRNMLQSNISDKYVNQVCTKLVAGAKTSGMFPFNFATAESMLLDEVPVNSNRNKVIKALHEAIEAVGNSLSQFPGSTMACIDTSGSMQAPCSMKTKTWRSEAAGMLAGMAVKISGPGSTLIQFADKVKEIKEFTSPSELARKMKSNYECGGGNCIEPISWATKSKKKFDRIMLFSDLQIYGDVSWGGPSIKQAIDTYRKEVNPDCILHSFDVAGHGQAVTSKADKKTNLIGGFSERMLEAAAQFEGKTNLETGEKEKPIPTLEYIRKMF